MNARVLAGFVLVLAAATAGAQAVVQPPSGDTLPPFERPNGMLLRPGSFVYQLSLRQDTVVRDLGTRAVDVTEASLGGQPGWLVAESRVGTVVPTSDSLYLSRADLSPTRWIGAIGSARLAVSFTRDTMFGAMQSYQGRASFITDVPPGALLTAGMVDRIVELLPLQAGYRTGASLVLIELGTPRAVPAVIAVEREESVVLADKSVDCWVVRLTAGALEERLWVSKDSPRVVKTEQATATGVLTALLRPIQVVPEQPVAAFGNLPPGEPLIIPGSPPIYLPPDTFAPVQFPTSAPPRVPPPVRPPVRPH
ncbi:MAG TPA: hypothetical protein VGG78_02810 [Gemmatimonadaceae bacterium]